MKRDVSDFVITLSSTPTTYAVSNMCHSYYAQFGQVSEASCQAATQQGSSVLLVNYANPFCATSSTTQLEVMIVQI